ncbi:hypothetical protein [Brevibacterium oceani]|uniref:hypothetical protein n=1 Tax=Brevibacterium oceani TaxID=358099 RepID=UPI0015E770BA|nr:hypothetical protein [Brevibacterium oceani]WGP08107.1 hypothetical protein QFE97_19030 [Bacillus subtilis]
MGKISRRNTTREMDPKAVEEFAAAAAENTVATPEEPLVSTARPDLPRHRLRAKTGTKGPGTSFRYNKSQGRLLDYAVEMEDMKKQELLESLIWPILEEKYGDQVPLDS